MHSTPLSETNMFDRKTVCNSHHLASLITFILRYKMQFQSNSVTTNFWIIYGFPIFVTSWKKFKTISFNLNSIYEQRVDTYYFSPLPEPGVALIKRGRCPRYRPWTYRFQRHLVCQTDEDCSGTDKCCQIGQYQTLQCLPALPSRKWCLMAYR